MFYQELDLNNTNISNITSILIIGQLEIHVRFEDSELRSRFLVAHNLLVEILLQT